jgi:hypothetical protein
MLPQSTGAKPDAPKTIERLSGGWGTSKIILTSADPTFRTNNRMATGENVKATIAVRGGLTSKRPVNEYLDRGGSRVDEVSSNEAWSGADGPVALDEHAHFFAKAPAVAAGRPFAGGLS